ncbi:CYFA0S11e03818g1_1 [Cyberlindnera fabianii]|uniref:CYFA0S11e03818g1_1 n=1 Tax=Cyberlindnera fabianii TaxID=36022 RepID=A0A061B063_CYBFA|nr:Synchronized import protein 1 [Cyberlindnera fabianii]CDR43313.1 CYFA0S11e03818g1_1 [Cyberlindnera fabianii]
MGKLKKRSRSAKSRVNPLATRAKQDKQDDTLTKNKIVPMIEKLKSAIPNDRSMALGSIAVMSDDPRMRKLLLKEKLVQIILERCLTDNNPEFVMESFGLLRNLVIDEGYDVAVYLWRQNIMITIEKSLEKCKTGFEHYVADPKKYGKVESTQLFDLTENLISLITGLAGSSEDIFDAIQIKIQQYKAFIKSILEFAISGTEQELRISNSLLNSILDLIYDFASQSQSFIQQLTTEWNVDFNTLNIFINTSTRINALSRVYIQGINLQLLESANISPSTIPQNIATIISTTISQVTSIDISAASAILLAEVDNTQPESLKDDAKRRANARSELQAVQLAVEIITAAIELTAFLTSSTNDNLYALYLNQVPEVLVALLTEEVYRGRALTAINNLCWLFVTVQYALAEWEKCAVVIWGKVLECLSATELDVDQKITAFGSLWAILEVLGDEISVDDGFVKQTLEEYEKTLTSKISDADEEQKVEYLSRLIGFLGCLAKGQGHVERNRVIGGAFMATLNKLPAVPSAVVIEILDVFYEIYGDAEFDYDESVFVQEGYLEKLQQVSPRVKTAVKLVDRNRQPELKSRGDEVFNNLGRFIQYKKSERR